MNDVSASDRVAYLGPEGTYSHAALLKFFGPGQNCVPLDEIPTVFNSVACGECDYGLVPIENSTEGSITQTLDCFAQSDLTICGEVLLRIQHCLLVKPGTDKADIQRIVSHQQSLGQCRHWLEENFPKVDKVPVSSNGEAAKIAMVESGVAAIAGQTAADIYQLTVLQENIEDIHDNTTRFAIISKQPNAPVSESVNNKIKSSLIISTRNEPGALFDALEPFKTNSVNLIKLESRPSRKEAWSYSFFVDIEGHCQDANIRAALDELSRRVLEFRVLGSYPAATIG